ncbi:hypothetical protein KIN20_019379 [Parelaphostrongylus tenuis]|uniref:Uncharacterized protein n=1 Tax=Parelaphostrongylus tenuis TaxID=148309 RepID=A0AAD5QSD5_PARTN|nr:hypothetical protein KIN20_019379 [Parelaphostrongylus tenuis]
MAYDLTTCSHNNFDRVKGNVYIDYDFKRSINFENGDNNENNDDAASNKYGERESVNVDKYEVQHSYDKYNNDEIKHYKRDRDNES